MKRKTAGPAFLVVCIVLAVLLLTKAIRPILASAIFAVALVSFGILSGGFRKD